MKDPLQPFETPYEVLGIGQAADKKEIDDALKKALTTGKSVSKARNAWSELSKPADRIFTDLFLYNDTFLDYLVPWIDMRSVQLDETDERLRAARLMKKAEKSSFPNAQSTHALAVLYYWSAVALEEYILANPMARALRNYHTRLTDLWREAIARWAAMIAGGQIWKEWSASCAGDPGPSDIGAVRAKLQDHFTTLFHKYMDRHTASGDAQSAARFFEYEYLLYAEARTAGKFMESGFCLEVDGNKKNLECGYLLLKQIGLVDLAKRELRLKNMGALEKLLSEYAAVQSLIENKRYSEAIEVLNRLPQDEIILEEPQTFRAEALQELGRQRLEEGEYKDAFGLWRAALATGFLQQKTRETVASLCRQAAVKLQTNDPESAVSVLKSALEIVPGNQEIQSTLAEILLQGAIKAVNAAEKDYSAGKLDRDAFHAVLQKGVSDVEAAIRYDPGNDRLKEQLEGAKRLLYSVDFYGVYKLLEQKQWSDAEMMVSSYLKDHPGNETARKVMEICQQNLCWFCKHKKNKPDDRYAYKVAMHKVVERYISSVRYQSATVSVPRCKDCYRSYRRKQVIFWLTGIPAVVASVFVSPIFTVIVVVTMIVIGCILLGTNAKKHPSIVSAVKDGWSFGAQPPNTQ